MSTKRRMEKYLFTVSLLVFALFIYTGADKLLQHQKFDFQMGLSPNTFVSGHARELSWIIPGIEIGLALLVCVDQTALYALTGSLLLMIAFEVYLSISLISGEEHPCACAGLISKMSWGGHLAFNAAYILLLLGALVAHARLKRLNYPPHI